MPTDRGYLPCPELTALLLPAYKCRHFDGGCAGAAVWDPDRGFVPRGFIGALGRLDDVKLVLLLAEPGNGLPGESHPFAGEPRDFLNELCRYVFDQFEAGSSLFHKNVRYILDRCWPGLTLRRQLERTWITESYLCSAPYATAPVLRRSERTCAESYLAPQLDLLRDRVIVALGGKADSRTARLPGIRVHRAFAVGPPGCNHRGARPTWDRIPTLLRERYGSS